MKPLVKQDDPARIAKDLDKEEPTADDLYSVGTAAVIMRMLKLPDGDSRLVQGLTRQVESRHKW
jgi:ATP-dependent Lon protease